jgi:hypothetical protein
LKQSSKKKKKQKKQKFWPPAIAVEQHRAACHRLAVAVSTSRRAIALLFADATSLQQRRNAATTLA